MLDISILVRGFLQRARRDWQEEAGSMGETATEKTTEKMKCAYCGDEITDDPIRKRGKIYCCEACAFEAVQAKACDGRERY